LLAVGEHESGHVDEQALRMSNAFAGGVAGSHQEMCGALSAGIMLIGLRYGRVSVSEDDKASLRAAAEIRKRFIERFGATRCDDVRIPGKRCTWVVEDTSRILLDVLDEDWHVIVAEETAQT
jgi:C_GCAxxG_C_C family probable redox protein